MCEPGLPKPIPQIKRNGRPRLYCKETNCKVNVATARRAEARRRARQQAALDTTEAALGFPPRVSAHQVKDVLAALRDTSTQLREANTQLAATVDSLRTNAEDWSNPPQKRTVDGETPERVYLDAILGRSAFIRAWKAFVVAEGNGAEGPGTQDRPATLTTLRREFDRVYSDVARLASLLDVDVSTTALRPLGLTLDLVEDELP